MKDLDELILKINNLPDGYISSKKINGKTYHYLQRRKLGKVLSLYIKESELDFYKSALKERKDIEEALAKYLNRGDVLKENLSKRDLELTGDIMCEDRIAVSIYKDKPIFINYEICPLEFLKGSTLSAFLKRRTLDEDRVNSRLLRKALNLESKEFKDLPLYVYGACVTDNYWFKPKGCKLHYKDIVFKSDNYHELSLKGDTRFISKKPMRNPQLTLLGSYEKAWRLIDKTWYLYKCGSEDERFSEMFVSLLAKELGIPTALYELDEDYIKTKNFADKYNFEPMSALAGDDQSYENVFNVCLSVNREIAKQYLLLMWFDCIVFNYDRHNENLGFLKNKKNGNIISLAPNFDNNNSLISRNNVLLEDRSKDQFINNFVKFIKSNNTAFVLFKEITLPNLTKNNFVNCFNNISIKRNEENICKFILNGYETLNFKLNWFWKID